MRGAELYGVETTTMLSSHWSVLRRVIHSCDVHW